MSIEPSGSNSGTDLAKAEQAVGAIVRKFFRNSATWLENVKDALLSVGKWTFVFFTLIMVYALGVTIVTVWDDPVLTTIVKVMPAAAGLALVSYFTYKMSKRLGRFAFTATALMLLSIVVLGSLNTVSIVAGKEPVDPGAFYGRIIAFFDFERTPLVIKDTEVIFQDREVQVPVIEYIDRVVEVPVKHDGVLKATVCPDRSFTRCTNLLIDQEVWAPIWLDFVPAVAIAENGWAVAGLMSETSTQEAWRVQQGWRDLKPFEQGYRWIDLKPLD